MLVINGTMVDNVDIDGNSPLHLAAKEGVLKQFKTVNPFKS